MIDLPELKRWCPEIRVTDDIEPGKIFLRWEVRINQPDNTKRLLLIEVRTDRGNEDQVMIDPTGTKTSSQLLHLDETGGPDLPPVPPKEYRPPNLLQTLLRMIKTRQEISGLTEQVAVQKRNAPPTFTKTKMALKDVLKVFVEEGGESTDPGKFIQLVGDTITSELYARRNESSSARVAATKST